MKYDSIISNRIIKAAGGLDGYTLDVCISSRLFYEGCANGTDSRRVMLTDSSNGTDSKDANAHGNGATASEEMVDKVLQYINATHACAILCVRSNYSLSKPPASSAPVILPLTAEDVAGEEAPAPPSESRIKRLSALIDAKSSSARHADALTMDQLYALWQPETQETIATSTLPAAGRESAGPPLLMKGALKKRGRFAKNWKLRQVVVEAGVLTYYTDSLEVHPYGENMKRRIALVGYDVEKLSPNRFRLFLAEAGGSKDLLLVCDAKERAEEFLDLWISGLRSHITYADKVMPRDIEIDTPATFHQLLRAAVGSIFGSESEALKDSAQLNVPPGVNSRSARRGTTISRPDLLLAPELRKGFVLKEGQVVRSWKCRFFVLADGIVAYYAKEAESPPYGSDVKGYIQLAGASIEGNGASTPPGAILAYGDGGCSRMQLTFKVSAERDAWIDSFNRHIAYADLSAAVHSAGDLNRARVEFPTKTSIVDMNKYSVFLCKQPPEQIVATAEVGVKVGMLSTSQTQQLLLTSSGRLLFIDYKIFEVKRSLSVGSQIAVEEVDADTFLITSRNDQAVPSITIRDASNGALFWTRTLLLTGGE